MERHPELATQVPHKRLVAVGLSPTQTVVHVQHVEALARQAARPSPVFEIDWT